MKNKKIVRVTTIPMSLKEFSNGLLQRLSEKYEVVAVSSPGEDLDFVGEREGVRTVAVPMERYISIRKDIKSLFKMIGVLRKERPYMVHSMTPKAGLISMTAAWLTRVPVRIHTFTGLVWPTSTGLKRTVLRMTDKLTCAFATHIIPEGQGVMNDLVNGGIAKKPMKVLGYGNVKGVDLDVFNQERFSNIDKDKSIFRFLFVGRIVGDKGINELVEAFTDLHEKYPKMRLVLIGNYEDALDPIKDVTKARIKANSAISFLGPKYGEELIEEYAKSDCLVMPSYREGFPNNVLEAGAMGLPCVVTDINGSREIIENEVNGLIVPSKNSTELYKAMERMFVDKESYAKMVEAARPMIASRFDKNFVQKCLIDFYEKVLKMDD